MRIRLKESITQRSELLAVDTEIEVSDLDASQLIAAGHAELVVIADKKPAKTQPKE
jgi:hypothetical protein